MGYEADWKAAKNKFEAATGADKPTKTGGLWKIKWRKSSGLEDAFKAVDKYYDGKSFDDWMAFTPKQMDSFKKAVEDLKKTERAYIPQLEKAIEDEKKTDKTLSNTYRDLKILKAELDKLVASAELQFAQIEAKRETTIGGVAGECKAFYEQLRKIKENLRLGCAKGVAKAQNLLKSLDAVAYNAEIETMARDITQPLQNIRDFSFPKDIIRQDKQALVQEAMMDKSFQNMARSLFETSQYCKTDIAGLLAVSGNTPTDASLVRMANNPPRLDVTTAGPDDVKAAVKHFIGIVKEVIELHKKLV